MKEIYLLSNDKRYEIKAKMYSFVTPNNNQPGTNIFRGVRWSVRMYRRGEEVDSINDVHFGKAKEGFSVCEHHVKMTQNTILYAAYRTGYFSRAMKEYDIEKIEKQWQKEHDAAKKRERLEQNIRKDRKLQAAM